MSVADVKSINKLLTFLTKHPKNNSIGELGGCVPGKSVQAFIRKHPLFFEFYEEKSVTRVRVRQFVSKTTGYKWRMCVDHYGGKCSKGDACTFRHGQDDTRDKPGSRSNAATAPTNNQRPVVVFPNKHTSKPTYVARNEQLQPILPVASHRAVEGKHCYLVPQEKRCSEIMDDLISQDVIAVDCEGVNLGAYGKLCLIQIATRLNVYVFDMCVEENERNIIISALKPVFKSNSIKKILHSLKNDNEALNAVGIINENFEDTQILFKELIKLRRSGETKFGLEALMQKYGFVHELKKKMKNVYKFPNRDFWAQRPLTPDMIQYAALDVANLVTVYKKLKDDIEYAINNRTPEPSKMVEKSTYAAAVGLPVGSELRLYFTDDKQPERRLPTDVNEGEAPKSSINAHELSEKVRIDNEAEERTLLELFPEGIKEAIKAAAGGAGRTLIEIVIDLGRAPHLIFIDGQPEDLDSDDITDMAPFVRSVLAKSQRNDFSRDNRIGIEGSLHRISAIKNTENRVIGLTYRIGRHFPHSAEIFTDLIARVAPQNISILLLGKPGKGKTTLLREFARLLANEYRQRVMIIDTSNEIGGDGDIAHRCIGRARRMPVIDKSFQHNTMVEAVQNHNPTVIIIDEIGTPKEAAAAKTISQRGVSLIGTAHGSDFDSLMKNPELVPLLGGIREVFLSDREATINDDGSKSKVKHERGGSPTFNVIVEIVEKNEFVIYDNVARVVDAKLNRKPYTVERRWFVGDQMFCKFEEQNTWA